MSHTIEESLLSGRSLARIGPRPLKATKTPEAPKGPEGLAADGRMGWSRATVPDCLSSILLSCCRGLAQIRTLPILQCSDKTQGISLGEINKIVVSGNRAAAAPPMLIFITSSCKVREETGKRTKMMVAAL